MNDIHIEISLKSYGEWDNTLKFKGSYEQIKEQVDLFVHKTL